MNLYVAMPWAMVEVKNVEAATFDGAYASAPRSDREAYAAHLDTSKFLILFADGPPTITRASTDAAKPSGK